MKRTGSGCTPIAVTMGEPAGIGPEITVRASAARSSDDQPIIVIGDPELYRMTAKVLGVPIEVVEITSPEAAASLPPHVLPIISIPLKAPVTTGRLCIENAAAVISSIRIAVNMAMAGTVSAVVTNPIHKAGLYGAEFRHPGHTEFLASLANLEAEPIMMLAGEFLRVVPVTRHLSLREAIETIDYDLIIETMETTVGALRRDFGIDHPRLAVTGLNPHAGEDGHLGHEEVEIIAPAIERLIETGIAVTGPHAADTLFHPGARNTYDAAICMYHDQALIPIKTIEFAGAVNVTLGLPFIRTSPDHGTALDIAGCGSADCSSLIAAISLADTIVHHRSASQDPA